jgi:hypothetical protein
MRLRSSVFEFKRGIDLKKKYPYPDFLTNITSEKDYQRWLYRKAIAHHRRDRNRCAATASPEMYRLEIHRAVLTSEGFDFYTSELLDWKLLSKYRNESSKHGRRTYKKAFALLPTVDHVGDAEGRPHFVICGWRTNDSKSDMSYKEFVLMCAQVIETAKGREEIINLHS